MGAQLERLVRLADADGGEHRGLMLALLRRISQSLFLQTPRGVQLHAALVAVTASLDKNSTDSCETACNDEPKVAEWWDLLKGYMDLGGDSGTRGSDDNVEGGPPAPNPGVEPTQLDIDGWEEERMQIQVESQEEDRFLRDREAEEQRQEEHDRSLYEAHQSGMYKDWENWVVLNTPSVPKRRRLTMTASSEAPSATSQDRQGVSTSITVPQTLQQFQIALRFDQEPDLPDRGPSAAHREETEVLKFGGPTFDRVYKAWKQGWITDAGVEAIFDQEWLFFFLANEVGDTQGAMRVNDRDEPRTGHGQDDEELRTDEGQGHRPGMELSVAEPNEGGYPDGVPGQESLPGGELAESQVGVGDGVGGRWAFQLRGGSGSIAMDDSEGNTLERED